MRHFELLHILVCAINLSAKYATDPMGEVAIVLDFHMPNSRICREYCVTASCPPPQSDVKERKPWVQLQGCDQVMIAGLPYMFFV